MNKIIDKIEIKKICKKDIKEIKEIVIEIYSKNSFSSRGMFLYNCLLDGMFKYNSICFLLRHSIKIVYKGKIIGVMVLSDFPITWILPEDKVKKYEGLRGLKSTFSGVLPKYQRKGIYNKMIEYVKENYKEFDYLWGGHQQEISTMDVFLKKREVISEENDELYTAQMLKY
jgi:hypothetical protein